MAISGRKRRESRRLRLSRQAINSIILPEGERRLEVYDETVRGLAVFITPKAKVFYLTRFVAGRLRRIRLGEYPALAPEAAREMAEQAVADLSRGKDPTEDRRKALERNPRDPSIGDLLAFTEETVWKGRAKRWAENRKIAERYASEWMKRPASSIDRKTAKRLHAAIGEANGHHAANRWRTVMLRLYRTAIEDFDYERANPFASVEPFEERSRERRMLPEELSRFLAALAAEPNETIRDIVSLALFTGARKANVFGMRYDAVDYDAKTWRIEPDESKPGVTVLLPLAPAAFDIIARRRKAAPDAEYVFTGRHGRKPPTDMTKPWHGILDRAGILRAGESDESRVQKTGEVLRFHDLRRTLASFMADTGATDLVINRALGQSSEGGNVSRVYARPELEVVRAAIVKAVDAMQATRKRKGKAR